MGMCKWLPFLSTPVPPVWYQSWLLLDLEINPITLVWSSYKSANSLHRLFPSISTSSWNWCNPTLWRDFFHPSLLPHVSLTWGGTSCTRVPCTCVRPCCTCVSGCVSEINVWLLYVTKQPANIQAQKHAKRVGNLVLSKTPVGTRFNSILLTQNFIGHSFWLRRTRLDFFWLFYNFLMLAKDNCFRWQWPLN